MSALRRSFVVAPLLREHLQRGDVLRLRTSGTSMLPLLRPGDVLGVVPARRHRDGDVIAYVRGETVVVHRLGMVPGHIFIVKVYFTQGSKDCA